MSNVSHFLYTDIAGAGKGWVLDVLATGRRNADAYVRAVHHGGKFQGKGGPGSRANCGAVTSAAQEILRADFERWINQPD